jgi:mRNA interferase HigB
MPRCGHIVLNLRLIKRSTLRQYAARFPKAGRPLGDWARLVLSGTWQNLVETRRMFPHADQVKVKSGRTVTIFNVCGNDFRLITAIHYDRQKVFVLNFLTHAEYTRNTWKNRL